MQKFEDISEKCGRQIRDNRVVIDEATSVFHAGNASALEVDLNRRLNESTYFIVSLVSEIQQREIAAVRPYRSKYNNYDVPKTFIKELPSHKNRRWALEKALERCQGSSLSSDDIVKLAEKFLKFVEGEEE